MKLLVLGGTEFVGRAVVDEALARGDEVAVFNRGTHAAPDGVTALRGDRTAPDGLAALARGRWDAVVDTWSWLRELPGAAPHRSDRPAVGLSPEAEARVLAGRA